MEERCVNDNCFVYVTNQSGSYSEELENPIETKANILGDNHLMLNMPDINQRPSGTVCELQSKDIQAGRKVDHGVSNNKSTFDSYQNYDIPCEMGSHCRDKDGSGGYDDSGDIDDNDAKKNDDVLNKDLVYSVDDVPTWYMSLLLGFQVCHLDITNPMNRHCVLAILLEVLCKWEKSVKMFSVILYRYVLFVYSPLCQYFSVFRNT